MVMVMGHDRVAQASISGDVDAALVSEDACIIMPIGEARAKSGRDSTWEGMEGIKDQQVGSGGGAKFVREGGVDEVDKEFVREEGDRLIVCIGSRDMIWSAG